MLLSFPIIKNGFTYNNTIKAAEFSNLEVTTNINHSLNFLLLLFIKSTLGLKHPENITSCKNTTFGVYFFLTLLFK